jgi:hypothetical protein
MKLQTTATAAIPAATHPMTAATITWNPGAAKTTPGRPAAEITKTTTRRTAAGTVVKAARAAQAAEVEAAGAVVADNASFSPFFGTSWGSLAV